MKIEIGKKYATRAGGIATVVSGSPSVAYPYTVVSPSGCSYTCTEQGFVWGIGAPNGGDLIALASGPRERIKALDEQLACSERAVQKWESTAASIASTRDYYARIIKEVADVIGPAAYTGDDGTVQSEPLRARLACRVQDLQATILEQERQLQRYKALLPPAPPALEMQVGGAYLTRGGNIVIVVSSDEDPDYPFDVETEDGSRWCVTPAGTEFRLLEGEEDLVSRIRFPESPVVAPEGFVCVGNRLLPEYHDAADIRVCSWGDDGSTHYSVRIGSPVHFAFAAKFHKEA